MIEGDVVIVTGPIDERIKEAVAGDAIGTIVFKTSADVWVLLANGNFWIGSGRQVFLHKESE